MERLFCLQYADCIYVSHTHGYVKLAVLKAQGNNCVSQFILDKLKTFMLQSNSNIPIVKYKNVHHTTHPMGFVLDYHRDFLGESLESHWNDFLAARCRCLLHFHRGPGTPAQLTEGHKAYM